MMTIPWDNLTCAHLLSFTEGKDIDQVQNSWTELVCVDEHNIYHDLVAVRVFYGHIS